MARRVATLAHIDDLVYADVTTGIELCDAAPTDEAAAAYPAICKIISEGGNPYQKIHKHLFQLRHAYLQLRRATTYFAAIPGDLSNLVSAHLQHKIIATCDGRVTAQQTFMFGLPWSHGHAPGYYIAQPTTMIWYPNVPGGRRLHLYYTGRSMFCHRNTCGSGYTWLHIAQSKCKDSACNEYTVHRYMTSAEIAQYAEDLQHGRVEPPWI